MRTLVSAIGVALTACAVALSAVGLALVTTLGSTAVTAGIATSLGRSHGLPIAVVVVLAAVAWWPLALGGAHVLARAVAHR